MYIALINVLFWPTLLTSRCSSHCKLHLPDLSEFVIHTDGQNHIYGSFSGEISEYMTTLMAQDPLHLHAHTHTHIHTHDSGAAHEPHVVIHTRRRAGHQSQAA
jgi:hypothetical protein